MESAPATDAEGPCPCYRLYGSCSFGENCRLRGLPPNACVFHFRGHCRYGRQCRFLHMDAPNRKEQQQRQAQRHQAAARESKRTDLHPCVRQTGRCSFGDQCRFATVEADVCVHWLKGNICGRDAACPWKHSRPEPEPASATAETPPA